MSLDLSVDKCSYKIVLTYMSFCSCGKIFHFSEIWAIRSFDGNFLISTLFNISLENNEYAEEGGFSGRPINLSKIFWSSWVKKDLCCGGTYPGFLAMNAVIFSSYSLKFKFQINIHTKFNGNNEITQLKKIYLTKCIKNMNNTYL